MTKIVSDYYLNEATLAASLQQQANKNLDRAVKIADSKITGLGFGIISNSIISHIVYLTQNEAEIRKQTKEAEEYLHQAKDRISIQSNKQLKIGNRNYYTAVF